MGFFSKIGSAVKNKYENTKIQWKALTPRDKAKYIVRGMTAFGLGWKAGDLIADYDNGPVVGACTFVAAVGTAGAASMVVGEATDIMVDAVADAINNGKVKGAINDD